MSLESWYTILSTYDNNCNMIPIGELQLLACLTCGVVVAGYVFYLIRKKRREKKFDQYTKFDT